MNLDHKIISTEASAPSNIALIKYMGKTDAQGNRPTNGSISWTLNDLRTFVKITFDPSLTEDKWECLDRSGLLKITLSEVGEKKFLNFFDSLKKEFRLSGYYLVQSANNFPSDCGLASSASSFAALTLCAHEFYLKKSEGISKPYTSKELSRLSQKGSGSSCRSFFSPWGLWHDSGAEEIQLPYKDLIHMVVICDDHVKSVSSSEAHKRVTTSELFKGRPERANERLQKLISVLRGQEWKKVFEICWDELWDMHNLFHTSKPHFIYMNSQSMECLNLLSQFWLNNNDGPIVTMDAGSNIHLLFRADQVQIYSDLKNTLSQNFKLWTTNAT